jgi:hypothetical protein
MAKETKQIVSVNKGKKYDNTQIARIKRMEEILDKSSEVLLDLNQSLERYTNLADGIRELEQYYSGGQWQKDYADDEADKLPKDLKRGVLSEDALYEFLALRDEVLAKIKTIE